MKIFTALLFLLFLMPTLVLAQSKAFVRFEEDLKKMAAIMDELRKRKGIIETRVDFGGIDTPIKSADYQITYAAEALAYQKAQKFSSKSELKYSLQILANKILKAKVEVKKAIKNE